MSLLTDRRAGPRRPHFTKLDVHAALCAQLSALLGGEVVRSRQTAWHSVTFAGARHQVVLRTAATPARLTTLPEHDFALADAFVADLEVTDTDGPLVTIEALVVRE